MKELSFDIKHIPTKRIFDVLFSSTVLILFAPILLILALAIRFGSKGMPIYSHERIGRGGKPFRCYKLRTMYVDADIRLNELLHNNTHLMQEWKASRKLKNDPRVTPLGKLLRKTSLDEFPQFWNVLKGDLSIVGPRPVVYEEVVNHLGNKAPKILSIRPGLTCIWQVSGRNDVSYAQRIKLDEEYVDKRNLIMDIKLIAKTIPSMISSRGAY